MSRVVLSMFGSRECARRVITQGELRASLPTSCAISAERAVQFCSYPLENPERHVPGLGGPADHT
jgi:hypothetical protein